MGGHLKRHPIKRCQTDLIIRGLTDRKGFGDENGDFGRHKNSVTSTGLETIDGIRTFKPPGAFYLLPMWAD